MALRSADQVTKGPVRHPRSDGRTVKGWKSGSSANFEVVESGEVVPVRGAKQRALLALLALHRGQPIGAERLIDVLWEDGQSANPANALQAQIGQLRRTLGATTILTTEAGYALAIAPGDIDTVRFEGLVVEGRRLSDEGDARVGVRCTG